MWSCGGLTPAGMWPWSILRLVRRRRRRVVGRDRDLGRGRLGRRRRLRRGSGLGCRGRLRRRAGVGRRGRLGRGRRLGGRRLRGRGGLGRRLRRRRGRRGRPGAGAVVARRARRDRPVGRRDVRVVGRAATARAPARRAGRPGRSREPWRRGWARPERAGGAGGARRRRCPAASGRPARRGRRRRSCRSGRRCPACHRRRCCRASCRPRPAGELNWARASRAACSGSSSSAERARLRADSRLTSACAWRRACGAGRRHCDRRSAGLASHRSPRRGRRAPPAATAPRPTNRER